MEKEQTKKPYLKLFLSTLALSAFTFGGGFVIASLMKKKFVDELHWIDEEDMLNLIAIAQASPGAIAVNASILVGYRIAGFPGALVSILGTILPPLVILSVISLFYEAFKSNEYVAAALQGMQAGVAAIICDVVLSLGSNVLKTKDVLAILIMPVAFCAVFFWKVNVVYVILGSAALGICRGLLRRKEGKA
ncbi:MAG: chromate transporter [Clostridiales bacterium]|nr:chromate transporter [Clostridiales bacterium]